MKIEDVIICGVGAAGSNILLNLLCTHPELNFSVVDFDKVEPRNITPGTQPYEKADLNRHKVQAIQRIALVQRNKRIVATNTKLQKAADILALVTKKSATLLIDALDNAPSRNLFLGLPKSSHVLHVGFSALLTGEAVWDGVFTKMTESKSDADIDVCELHLARPFIQGLTALASIVATDFIETGKKNNIYFDRHLRIKVF